MLLRISVELNYSATPCKVNGSYSRVWFDNWNTFTKPYIKSVKASSKDHVDTSALADSSVISSLTENLNGFSLLKEDGNKSSIHKFNGKSYRIAA